MQKFILDNHGDETSEALNDEIPNTIISKFIEVMDDDFNSAVAIANLHTIFKYVNNIMKTAKKDNRQIVAHTLAKILKDLKEVYGILGLFKQEPEKFLSEMKMKHLKQLNIDVEDIEKQILERTEAKKSKDFEKADSIRDNLDKRGILLKDTREGTIWDLKLLYSFN